MRAKKRAAFRDTRLHCMFLYTNERKYIDLAWAAIILPPPPKDMLQLGSIRIYLVDIQVRLMPLILLCIAVPPFPCLTQFLSLSAAFFPCPYVCMFALFFYSADRK